MDGETGGGESILASLHISMSKYLIKNQPQEGSGADLAHSLKMPPVLPNFVSWKQSRIAREESIVEEFSRSD